MDFDDPQMCVMDESSSPGMSPASTSDAMNSVLSLPQQSLPAPPSSEASPNPILQSIAPPHYASKVDPSGDPYPVEFCRRDADMPLRDTLHLKHWWLRSPDFERGMGPADGGVPGHGGADSPYVSKTKITDHAGEGSKPGNGAECEPTGQFDLRYMDEDQSCLQDEMKLGRDTGTWTGTNQCHQTILQALEECRVVPPTPPRPADIPLGASGVPLEPTDGGASTP